MDEVNGEFNAVNFEEEAQIHEWQIGLPNVNDITPLNKGLVPLELLTAFNISPEPYLTAVDVTRASEDTLSSIRGQSNNFRSLDQIADDINNGDVDDDVIDDEIGKKPRRNESPEDADSAPPADGGGGGGEEKAAKRARLVWTPQLHKRFVDVVGHLGIKNAVPKTIMQLMNVEGLTRENVASHLQKYRLYMKRMGGGSGGGDGSGDNFDPPSGSAPEVGPGTMVPMPVPVPMMMGMGGYNGYHNQYNNGMVMQSGSGSNKFGGSGLGYHHHDLTNPNQGSGGQMMN